MAVDRLAKYKIQFIKLKSGTHHFNYQLDQTFFDCFENSKITEANINADVNLHKEQDHIFDLDFNVNGTAKMVCDRCLDEFNLPVQNHFNLQVKMTEKEMENEFDITYLPFNAYEINVAKYLYEVCHLALPMQLKCADSKTKECNSKILRKLEELDINNQESISDPRWDELKKLIKTENK